MKASEYVDIGHYLRDSRESLQITKEQAADALHIRARYLDAIENGRLDELPGKAYSRGYIKNYVEYLKLDLDDVMGAYESLLAHEGHGFFVPKPTLRQNLPSRWILWLSLAGIALLYCLWYFNVRNPEQAGIGVSDVPEKFLHLLDKSPVIPMDKPLEDCLRRGDAACFVTLHQKRVIPAIR